MDWFSKLASIPNIYVSLIIIIGTLIVRQIILYRVKGSPDISVERKRRLVVQIRNTALPFILVLLLIVWASEIKSFAISLFAVAAAVVIATKELLMCLSGYVVRSFAHAFSIGDRIEIDGIRGDVIDMNFLTTTLVEIGPGHVSHQYTGRTIVFPNSIFVTSPMINETFTGMYVLHTFSVPLNLSDDWKDTEGKLLAAAHAECRDFLEDAQKRMNSLSKKESLDVPSVEPRVTIQLPEPGRIDLLVRVPSPARRKGRIEQAILRRVFGRPTN